MILPWVVALIVSVVLNVVAYAITPKPKAPKPDAVEEGQVPTASAGRSIPVIFGTVMIKEPNVLWHGDKSSNTTEIKA